MSVGAHTLAVPSRFAPANPRRFAELSPAARSAIRAGTFAALALYATARWARLLSAPPTARLIGLVGLAVVIAAVIPVARRRLGGPPAAVATFALCLLALPISGLPWQDFVHLRLALGDRHVSAGLSGLPAAILPYSGPGRWVPTVIVLGAAVLLLDAAVVLAYAPRMFGDLRRAGAALPLVALAVVPATLVRPEFPYLQGTVLFALLAAFLWGERLRRQTAGTAFALCAVAAVGASVLAPRIDAHHALVDYRAWAGGAAHPRADSFVWNQTYGPLHWPRRGRVVLTVQARAGDYWKAENLDTFNGTAWTGGATAPPLPAPDPAAVDTWSQAIKVTIGGMRSPEVIASGYAAAPAGVPGGDVAGASDGTWTALRTLTPGASYSVLTYTPHPSATQLRTAGRAYPDALLQGYRSMRLGEPGVLPAADPELVFPPFYARAHARRVIASEPPPAGGTVAQALARSPYGPVYQLARRLAAGARTPYDVVTRIKAYLRAHESYNESPPLRPAPLAAFLLRDHIGYCQQFSGAMALLLRMDGIPARVATGFTAGVRQGATGPFTVTDVDAHAWDEVWFPGYGWVTVDPTPPAAPALGGKSSLPIDKSQILGHSAGAGSHAAPRVDPGAGAAPTAVSRGGGVNLAAIVALLVVLTVAGGALLVLRRGADDLESRLAELERALLRTGRPLRAGVTLAEIEHRFHSTPEAAAYVRALRLARYRPAGGGAPPPGARRALRRELGAGLGVRGRIRALWALPPRR